MQKIGNIFILVAALAVASACHKDHHYEASSTPSGSGNGGGGDGVSASGGFSGGMIAHHECSQFEVVLQNQVVQELQGLSDKIGSDINAVSASPSRSSARLAAIRKAKVDTTNANNLCKNYLNSVDETTCHDDDSSLNYQKISMTCNKYPMLRDRLETLERLERIASGQ